MVFFDVRMAWGSKQPAWFNPPPKKHVGGGRGVTQGAPATSNRTYRISIQSLSSPCHPESKNTTYVHTHFCSLLISTIPQTNKGRSPKGAAIIE